MLADSLVVYQMEVLRALKEITEKVRSVAAEPGTGKKPTGKSSFS